MKKLRVAILFGGRSTEHEISLLSAMNVINALDREKFIPVLIGIDKTGTWHYNDDSLRLLNPDDPKRISVADYGKKIVLSHNANDHKIVGREESTEIENVDVIFPVLHGTFGEDGSVQGLAKLANLPCVGCGILGSSIGLDKDIMKRILRDAGIGIADFFTFRKGVRNPSYEEVVSKLGVELFIKPANLGSSVGVSFVKNKEDFEKALEYAFKFDRKVIVEEKISGREIEIAVLGNEHAQASIPGEILPKSGFYSFENKYVDEHGADLKIPAELSEDQVVYLQELALETFQVLECSGMARVDFFLKEDGKAIINEINTIPGFTKISMYPKLWEHTGLSQKDLITRLIHLAIERQNENLKLQLIP